ncbi:MAG: hypothetical protein ACLGIT_13765 [Gammaproteobacteria bacterium]|uniref:hypothetical protein n=1 Tax=Azohydromonas sp. TaxID=1872666 RepID=UPI002C4DD6F5|nr:hypothetical protein [Azohydromonas sp.]HMM86721.1 hypothetical protein [Azohydromonas sp.]
MLESIRRWWSSKTLGRPFPELADWAERKGHDLRVKPEGDGLIVESRAPGDAWRLEWGASQRRYIDGFELRLRADLGGGDAVHMLVLNRRLMQSLEAEVFKQYTEDLQTRIDDATPDEMRWLVLYPRLPSAQLGALRDHFGATGYPPDAIAQWVGSSLSKALADAATGWLDPSEPLVLIAQRGRLTMRLPLPWPELARIESALALMRTAVREARVAVDRHGGGRGAPSTQPGLWARSDDADARPTTR